MAIKVLIFPISSRLPVGVLGGAFKAPTTTRFTAVHVVSEIVASLVYDLKMVEHPMRATIDEKSVQEVDISPRLSGVIVS